ncbi:nuclease-related domain-containing protein [Streptomyces mobaraensis]|uniref:NERD domain-containing protein n=1 Tax=Streptomyces mobaraensis TaxID=35621 RepID=A0A5N5W7K7_STRMB|nr:nuclease-related domain-containing protein [Streptomyces mobaraensis]KAB7843585.1 NERD domain-containing protein [Streptomyces mobaraensis]
MGVRERPGTGAGAGAGAGPGAKGGAVGRRYDPDRLFLPPDDDLAPNRPGETLRARLDASRAGRGTLLLARLLGRRPAEDRWRRALAAEQQVGAALDGLTAGGWEVLHSVVLPGDAVIPHLLIGPGGVFAVLVEPTRRAPARADDAVIRVPRERHPRPAVRRARQSAARASLVLTRGCGFPVPVGPVVVLPGATEVHDESERGDVRVLLLRQVTGLRVLGGVLHPDRVDRVHTVARNRRLWLGC